MRSSVSKIIDEQSHRQLNKQRNHDLEQKKSRIRDRAVLGKQETRIRHHDEDPTGHFRLFYQNGNADSSQLLDRTLTDLVPRLTRSSRNGVEIEEGGRLRVHNDRTLGQYLLDAARLYEAMAMFRDRRMMEKYLYKDPPLHPRRTLDQSHYWTLKTTKARDRDQVVYRSTNGSSNVSHKLRKIPMKSEPEPWLLRALGQSPLRGLKALGDQSSHPTQVSGEPTEGVNQSRCGCRGENESRFSWRPRGRRGSENEHWQWIGHW